MAAPAGRPRRAQKRAPHGERSLLLVALAVFCTTAAFFTVLHWDDSWISRIHVDLRGPRAPDGGSGSLSRTGQQAPAPSLGSADEAQATAQAGAAQTHALAGLPPNTTVFITFATASMADFAFNWRGSLHILLHYFPTNNNFYFMNGGLPHIKKHMQSRALEKRTPPSDQRPAKAPTAERPTAAPQGAPRAAPGPGAVPRRLPGRAHGAAVRPPRRARHHAGRPQHPARPRELLQHRRGAPCPRPARSTRPEAAIKHAAAAASLSAAPSGCGQATRRSSAWAPSKPASFGTCSALAWRLR